ncbi:uncharacterized protein LOC106164348 [Lingula anatina]|uniref:Uncharacterized protein LOC106164348 n=1 Tax=Lingula anatina TaxID=7574 RepID=A0A1S3IHJ0_LINAN|nr:uncharacterized protein LOC106164348 [Lingula anatina]XP_013397680.1 uncharacterized protein LOC106164348 [Lingula anatina]XP_013397682.1 uncharacterized protein LOC106164348 [Lingula anatina]|eukprot:XP_013397679.1 uncharacterized protein LOC106164348 [Lingula anatina]
MAEYGVACLSPLSPQRTSLKTVLQKSLATLHNNYRKQTDLKELDQQSWNQNKANPDCLSDLVLSSAASLCVSFPFSELDGLDSDLETDEDSSTPILSSPSQSQGNLDAQQYDSNKTETEGIEPAEGSTGLKLTSKEACDNLLHSGHGVGAVNNSDKDRTSCEGSLASPRSVDHKSQRRPMDCEEESFRTLGDDGDKELDVRRDLETWPDKSDCDLDNRKLTKVPVSFVPTSDLLTRTVVKGTTPDIVQESKSKSDSENTFNLHAPSILHAGIDNQLLNTGKYCDQNGDQQVRFCEVMENRDIMQDISVVQAREPQTDDTALSKQGSTTKDPLAMPCYPLTTSIDNNGGHDSNTELLKMEKDNVDGSISKEEGISVEGQCSQETDTEMSTLNPKRPRLVELETIPETETSEVVEKSTEIFPSAARPLVIADEEDRQGVAARRGFFQRGLSASDKRQLMKKSRSCAVDEEEEDEISQTQQPKTPDTPVTPASSDTGKPSVHAWINSISSAESLDSPISSIGQDELDFELSEGRKGSCPGSIEDDLSLGAEAQVMYAGQMGMLNRQTSDPYQILGHTDARQRRTAYLKNQYMFGNSFESVRTSSSQTVSSIEMLLEQRKGDPEEILENLGFGGSDNDRLSTKLPLRFLLHPSQAHGISVEDFLQENEELRDKLHQLHGGPSGIPLWVLQRSQFNRAMSMPMDQIMTPSWVAYLHQTAPRHGSLPCFRDTFQLSSTLARRDSILSEDNRKALEKRGFYQSPKDDSFLPSKSSFGEKPPPMRQRSNTFSGMTELKRKQSEDPKSKPRSATNPEQRESPPTDFKLSLPKDDPAQRKCVHPSVFVFDVEGYQKNETCNTGADFSALVPTRFLSSGQPQNSSQSDDTVDKASPKRKKLPVSYNLELEPVKEEPEKSPSVQSVIMAFPTDSVFDKGNEETLSKDQHLVDTTITEDEQKDLPMCKSGEVVEISMLDVPVETETLPNSTPSDSTEAELKSPDSKGVEPGPSSGVTGSKIRHPKLQGILHQESLEIAEHMSHEQPVSKATEGLRCSSGQSDSSGVFSEHMDGEQQDLRLLQEAPQLPTRGRSTASETESELTPTPASSCLTLSEDGLATDGYPSDISSSPSGRVYKITYSIVTADEVPPNSPKPKLKFKLKQKHKEHRSRHLENTNSAVGGDVIQEETHQAVKSEKESAHGDEVTSIADNKHDFDFQEESPMKETSLQNNGVEELEAIPFSKRDAEELTVLTSLLKEPYLRKVYGGASTRTLFDRWTKIQYKHRLLEEAKLIQKALQQYRGELQMLEKRQVNKPFQDGMEEDLQCLDELKKLIKDEVFQLEQSLSQRIKMIISGEPPQLPSMGHLQVVQQMIGLLKEQHYHRSVDAQSYPQPMVSPMVSQVTMTTAPWIPPPGEDYIQEMLKSSLAEMKVDLFQELTTHFSSVVDSLKKELQESDEEIVTLKKKLETLMEAETYETEV